MPKGPKPQQSFKSMQHHGKQSKADNEKVIRFLLENGAETHHKDKDGDDLLDLCKNKGLVDIASLLSSHSVTL